MIGRAASVMRKLRVITNFGWPESRDMFGHNPRASPFFRCISRAPESPEPPRIDGRHPRQCESKAFRATEDSKGYTELLQPYVSGHCRRSVTSIIW